MKKFPSSSAGLRCLTEVQRAHKKLGLQLSIDKQAHIRNDSAADAQKEQQTDRVSFSHQITYLMKSLIIVAGSQY